MITSLTAEQKEKLKDYKKKYIAIGLNTDRMNREECIKDVNLFYTEILKRKAPRKVIICQSPYQAWRALCLFKFLVKIIIRKIKNKKIYSQEVRQEVDQEVRQEVDRNKKFLTYYISTWIEGSLDVAYFSFYSFMHYELGINYKCIDKYKIYEKLCNYGQIFALKNVCFVSEKPIKIKKKNRRLHADLEPALQYSDGFSLYRMHGVKIPKWLAITPADKLDVKKIMGIENVEVRKEAIQKIGLTNLMGKLQGKVLDKMNIYVDKMQKVYLNKKNGLNKISYELIEVDLKLSIKTKMLKMENPSLADVYHYEYVSPECNTVRDALKFRNGTEDIPMYLS